MFGQEEEHVEYKGDYAEIVDVSKPPVWSPEGHEEFSTTFRNSIRNTLLAMRRAATLAPICVLDSLGLSGEDSPEDMVGVAYAEFQEEGLVQQRVLYNVTSKGTVVYPDPDTIPFTSPDGSMPPQTTSPLLHKTYVKALNIHDYVFLYPDVFCPEARKRFFQRANARNFLRGATMLWEAEHEQDSDREEFERRTRQRIQ